jgi:hypothetical protein
MSAPKVKLILAVMLPESESIPHSCEVLEEVFGAAEAVSDPFVFLFSDYYRQEMGPGLRKFLVAVEPLFEASDMVRLKQKATQVEDRHRNDQSGNRRLNIDPGFLTASQFILTSRKDAAHRIFLADGVFAEISLLFSHGRYRPLAWTYPDYRLELIAGFLRKVRGRYLRQMRDDTGATGA